MSENAGPTPPERRERWDGRAAFVMAAVGSAVGLGNVWRFPYVCHDNGGGAFFIPYIVALLTAGIPLLILEFGVGQMMQGSAPASMKRINKHAEWIGWLGLLVGVVITVYYAVIMAWSVEYLGHSLKSFFTEQPVWSMYYPAWGEDSTGVKEAQFFKHAVQWRARAPEDMWQYTGDVILCLAAVWALVFAIICKGVKRVGKVVMLTVPIPVVVLLILIVRGMTLEGAGEGIAYYLTPNFDKLSNPKTWTAAYGQVFFSLTLGFGTMIAYASYMPRKSDVTNNAMMTAFANCAISFIAGFAVFSVIGYLAFAQGSAVKDTVTGGPGLAFVTYPAAISQMGKLHWIWPPLIGVLFFIMLLALGIDSLFSLVEGLVSGLRDRWPGLKQMHVTGAYCLLAFVVGVIFFANRVGLFWLDIFDHWANDYGLAIVGLLQCIVIGYFFHTDTLREYIDSVSEIKLMGWWKLCVKYITPAVLILLLGSQFIEELGKDNMYGIAEASSPAKSATMTQAARADEAVGLVFNTYVPVAAIVFALLFVAAFALARMWSALLLVAGGVAVFFLSWGMLSAMGVQDIPMSAPVLSGLLATLLVGGFVLCLRVALRARDSGDGGQIGDDGEPEPDGGAGAGP